MDKVQIDTSTSIFSSESKLMSVLISIGTTESAVWTAVESAVELVADKLRLKKVYFLCFM